MPHIIDVYTVKELPSQLKTDYQDTRINADYLKKNSTTITILN